VTFSEREPWQARRFAWEPLPQSPLPPSLVIEKDEMTRVLHAEHELADRFIAYMLARNIRVEEDLIDQLFNSTEKRLARTLLLLARYGKEDQPEQVLQKVSQEMLAENWYDAFSSESLYEQVQKTRLHRIQRQD
jgi:CRP-like cAMP-binding protein